MKKLLLIFLLLLTACARQPQLQPPTDAAIPWAAMLAHSGAMAKDPFRIQFSLRFGPAGNTRRVTGVLWGNEPELVRLDIQAGIGATAAKAVEGGDGLVLFMPMENKAYFRDGPARPLTIAGAPLPFNLARLASLLCGRFPDVFSQQYASAQSSGSNIRYELEAPPGGFLTVAPDGLPLHWQHPDGWQLEISYNDREAGLPYRLRLSAPDGNQAIILIREREKAPQPFTGGQLELELPAGVRLLPMRDLHGSTSQGK